MLITHATLKGTRGVQEDRLVVSKITNQGILLAVMDGHSGSDVADYIAQNLVEIFSQEIQLQPPLVALANTFKKLHDEVKSYRGGSTLSLVWLPVEGKQCFIAILGDSPVIVIIKKPKDLAVWVSPFHNVRSNMAERRGALARGGIYGGGYIWSRHGNYGLQLSRALGDMKLDGILNRTPELFTLPITKRSFIILVTDGILDPAHDRVITLAQIKRIVAMVEEGKGAPEIVADAVSRQTGDNATVIICRI